jgi:hypothetical protein
VQASASFLRSLPYREYVDSAGQDFESNVFDLSGEVQFTLLLRSPDRRLVPYVSGGLGVHALASRFGDLSLDQRYNSNNFGVSGSWGMLIRAGSGHAFIVEQGGLLANNVSRWVVRVGVARLFGDLR